MALSCTTVQWRGLTLSSDRSSPFGIRTLAGWDELPAGRFEVGARPSAHGVFAAPVWSDERIVTLGGQIISQDRDALLAELSAAMTWGSSGGLVEDLQITRAGQTLTARARLTAFKTPTDGDWAVGLVPFAIEWRCPDPLRYAEPFTVATPLPRVGGALRFPLFTDGEDSTGALTFGTPTGPTGVVEVTNTGTADTHLVLTITGPTPAQGFDVLVAGQRIRYSREVPAGQVLTIDTATGRARLADGADRDAALTIRQWRPIHPGETVHVAFVSLGGWTPASLGVTLRPAYW